MQYATCITTALVAATGLAFAMPAAAQTPAPNARPALFDFAKLDANADGKVTMEEITAARDAAAKALDANGDGNIDEAELLAFQTAQIEARVKAEFAALDADGNGTLSAAELAAHRIVRATPVLPQAMFDRVDTDKDGAISQAEYDAAKTKLRQFAQSQRDYAQQGLNSRNNGGRNPNMTGRNQPENRPQGNNRSGQSHNRGWLPFWHR